jgi:hypothetical protein
MAPRPFIDSSILDREQRLWNGWSIDYRSTLTEHLKLLAEKHKKTTDLYDTEQRLHQSTTCMGEPLHSSSFTKTLSQAEAMGTRLGAGIHREHLVSKKKLQPLIIFFTRTIFSGTELRDRNSSACQKSNLWEFLLWWDAKDSFDEGAEKPYSDMRMNFFIFAKIIGKVFFLLVCKHIF